MSCDFVSFRFRHQHLEIHARYILVRQVIVFAEFRVGISYFPAVRQKMADEQRQIFNDAPVSGFNRLKRFLCLYMAGYIVKGDYKFAGIHPVNKILIKAFVLFITFYRKITVAGDAVRQHRPEHGVAAGIFHGRVQIINFFPDDMICG